MPAHPHAVPPRTRLWHDLAALLDPAGVAPDPLADARVPDWVGIYRLAAAQLVAPGLYVALAARQRLEAVPEPVRMALAELYRLNAERNDRLRAVLRDTVRLLNAAGFEPLLLKGAVALLPASDPLAAARMLSDLDLALCDGTAEQGEQVLRAAGYRDADNCNPDHYGPPMHHAAPLFHPSGDGYVELHRSLLAARVPAAALPLTRVVAAAEPVAWDGLRLRIPVLTHRLLHNALHHQVQDQGFYSGRRSLRQLHEFARLRALPDAAAIDWPRQLAELDRLGPGNAVRGWLLAAERLFGQPLPPGVSPCRAARRAEARFWFRVEYPRLWSFYQQARRLRHLPQRLITPSWYPAKYRALQQRWFPGSGAGAATLSPHPGVDSQKDAER